MQAEVRIERNSHAITRDALGEARHQLRMANATIKSLTRQVAQLRSEVQQKNSIIAQLEDLKL